MQRFVRLLKKSFRYVRKHKWKIIVWGLGAFFFLTGLLLLWAATLPLPDLTSLSQIRVDQSVKIYDRTGQVLLYSLNNNDVQRTVVPLSQVSSNIEDAIIAIEDPTFYQNNGIDPKAILRSIYVDVTHLGAAQGGSTLTQQVIKNTVLTDDKSIARKIKEWVLALKLTRALTKQQILELYVNQVPFGGSLYGVEEASQTFFGIPAANDDLAQAAYLAAVLPAPSYYSPYGNNKSSLDARKNLVLQKMYQAGYITIQQETSAEAEQVAFMPQKTTSITAPHFVFYVQQYLENKYGADALQTSGWKVTTTLDADLQVQAETIVKQNALSNATKFNASNAGLIALDPNNGQILAMVGSRNYFDKQIDGAYNVTLADRQPGSAFKPFVYAEAFSQGYTPDTVLFDVPTQFSTQCSAADVSNDTPPCYSPVDYDNLFRGPMTLRDAIAQSINVPSVKLLYLTGISNSLQLAKSMGISTLGDPNQYGLTLVLGGGEVTLLDMTSAYGTFATGGTHYPATAVLKIEDQNGNVIEDNSQPAGTQVVSSQVANEINDVLSDPVARAPLGENEYLQFAGHDVAVKTGTTNNYKDAWTIGYTPNLVVGIWAGNNDNTSMVRKVSGFIVGPMWNAVMQYAINKYPIEYFTRTQVSESNPKPQMQGNWQVAGQDGQLHELLYWVDRTNPNGPVPTNPAQDPQFNNWDTALHVWANANGYGPNSPQLKPYTQFPALLPGFVFPTATTTPTQ
ncbi:MAG: PBP1A family penicillin-binding protein [Patescibacteria group bacterium]|nr:PBP1A family penicillin-binding protein [Patescibacteria group bacterium]